MSFQCRLPNWPKRSQVYSRMIHLDFCLILGIVSCPGRQTSSSNSLSKSSLPLFHHCLWLCKKQALSEHVSGLCYLIVDRGTVAPLGQNTRRWWTLPCNSGIIFLSPTYCLESEIILSFCCYCFLFVGLHLAFAQGFLLAPC